jgi:DNA-binding response OmpR family regulator
MAVAHCSAEIPLLVIVDDDPSARTSTKRLIRSFGFRVEGFTSAQEFLESGCVQDVACLILDFQLPSMNGLELQHLLDSGSHRLPIIFVSANGSDQDKKEAKEAGAVDFFRKPVDVQALVSAIQAAFLRGAPESEIWTDFEIEWTSWFDKSGQASTRNSLSNARTQRKRRLTVKTRNAYDAGTRINRAIVLFKGLP